MNQVKYPKYGAWCKQNVIETIRKQKINEEKKYLDKLVFDPNSDLYSSGVYDYDIENFLWIINGNDPDDLSKSLFSAVQHAFDEKYFQIAQKINPEMDMKSIRNYGGECLDLLYKTLENMTIDEIKDAVMYALDYGIEEIEEAKIQYVRTVTENIAKAIKSNLTKIESVHINYLDLEAKRKEIPVNELKDYLMHLNQSGIFANTINWRYIDLFDSGRFLIEGDISHNNGYELNVAIVAENKEDKYKIDAILRGSEE